MVFSLLSPGLLRGRAGKGLAMLLASASPRTPAPANVSPLPPLLSFLCHLYRSIPSTHTALLLLCPGPLPTAPGSQPAAGLCLGPVRCCRRGPFPSLPQIALAASSEQTRPGLRSNFILLPFQVAPFLPGLGECFEVCPTPPSLFSQSCPRFSCAFPSPAPAEPKTKLYRHPPTVAMTATRPR